MNSRWVVYHSLSIPGKWFAGVRVSNDKGCYYSDVSYFDQWPEAVTYAVRRAGA